MRIGMMIRDVEYREALVSMLSEFDRDIMVEIADSAGAGKGSVILTDIRPEELDPDVIRQISRRTVFLCEYSSDLITEDIPDIHRVFKYSDIAVIMAEITLVYAEWTGDMGEVSPVSRVIAVCSENDMLSSDRCRAIARQIIYRQGGRILILSLSFINDYGNTGGRDVFRKLMYFIDGGRDYRADAFTFTDSYGISYLDIPRGINPVASLDSGYLSALIRTMGSKFDLVILDAGTCYRKENLDIIRSAGDIVWFGSGIRIEDPSVITGDTEGRRAAFIDPGSGRDETLMIDDYVRGFCDAVKRRSGE